MRVFSSIIVCLLLIMGMGCQANLVDESANEQSLSTPLPGATNEGGTTPMSPTLETPLDPGIQRLVDIAIADLASRLSVSPSEITLVEATPMVWSDSSLGCPQPGMAYLQVPEDGLLIRLEAKDQIYAYHSGGTREPFLCETTLQDPGKPPQIDLFNLTPPTVDPDATPDNSIPPGENQ